MTPGTVKVYKYHGIRKVIDLDALIEHDLVMTTYATLTSDFARRISLLQRIVWFRVVLDEGMISGAGYCWLSANAETL